jgi:hypothetical protein
MWKKAVAVCFMVLSQKFIGRTKESHENFWAVDLWTDF